jgi:type IV pilus assembly protein PilQ
LVAAADVARYTGQKISLDLQQADIRDVVRVLAEVSGLNIVMAPEVKGTVTARLLDVPWDQALDAVLNIHALAQERQGNVVFIAPLGQLLAQRQAQQRLQQTERHAAPRVTQIIPIQYRDAAELKATLEKHLGPCAAISVDVRTNTLIITGTPACLQQQR